VGPPWRLYIRQCVGGRDTPGHDDSEQIPPPTSEHIHLPRPLTPTRMRRRPAINGFDIHRKARTQERVRHDGMAAGTPRVMPVGKNQISSLGGESGIRTHGTLSRTHAFQACALSRSAISPASEDGCIAKLAGSANPVRHAVSLSGTQPSASVCPFEQPGRCPPPTASWPVTRLPAPWPVTRPSSKRPETRSAEFRLCRIAASASCPLSASPAASVSG
jgi:hypothetical protein